MNGTLEETNEIIMGSLSGVVIYRLNENIIVQKRSEWTRLLRN